MTVPQAQLVDLALALLAVLRKGQTCCASTRELADTVEADLDRTRRALAWLAEEGDVERAHPPEHGDGRSWYWRVPEARR